MPEFVIVAYPVRRRVIINGAPNGFTNDTLIVSRATHQFDLGTPPDYTPLSQTVAVAGTTPTAPMTVSFQPVVAAVSAPSGFAVALPRGGPGGGAARTPAARKRPRRTTTARKTVARKKTRPKKTGTKKTRTKRTTRKSRTKATRHK